MEYYSLQKDNKFSEEKIITECLDFKKNIVLENLILNMIIELYF